MWAKRKNEFEKRAAFALLASLVMKDKKATAAQFAMGLVLVEKAAIATAKKLAASEDATARWIGKDALRDLASPASQRRLARQVARA